MPQAPAEVEVYSVGVKHDYADDLEPVVEGAPSVSEPPPTYQVHDDEWDQQ